MVMTKKAGLGCQTAFLGLGWRGPVDARAQKRPASYEAGRDSALATSPNAPQAPSNLRAGFSGRE